MGDKLVTKISGEKKRRNTFSIPTWKKRARLSPDLERKRGTYFTHK